MEKNINFRDDEHLNDDHRSDHPKNGGTRNANQKNNNRASEQGMLTGMFRDRRSTENAYNSMHERGYTEDEINLVMSKETHEKYFSGDKSETELGNKAAAGSGAGSAIGGTIGAIAGIIAAIGTSVVIPGLGIVVAGPIAAGLAGAGAGGIAGGIIGALVGWGIPKDRAKIYESAIKDGHIVLGVKPKNDEDAEYFERTWHENDGREIHR
ncbi:MAG: hypothetical protein JJU13_00365 [Balneolaceae bacterium]|nr:hypothetical protein [Balneolaceae bacterium]